MSKENVMKDAVLPVLLGFIILSVTIYIGIFVVQEIEIPKNYCLSLNGTWVNNITCADRGCPPCESYCKFPNKTILCVENMSIVAEN